MVVPSPKLVERGSRKRRLGQSRVLSGFGDASGSVAPASEPTWQELKSCDYRDFQTRAAMGKKPGLSFAKSWLRCSGSGPIVKAAWADMQVTFGPTAV